MDFYKKLKKITRPVAILVERRRMFRKGWSKQELKESNENMSRFRVLFPDGRCKWMPFIEVISYNQPTPRATSCFQSGHLEATVDSMRFYDESCKLHIVSIMEL